MHQIVTGSRQAKRHLPADEPALVCSEGVVAQPFHYWRGASGNRYLHTVFPLVDCPLMPRVNYILVRREVDGTRLPLAIGQTTSVTDSLNLAHLRRAGARMGANEIHIHFLPETVRERAIVEADLAARQLGHSAPSREFQPANDGAETVCA